VQQVSVFLLTFTVAQQAWGGLQQSPSGQQLGAGFAVTASSMQQGEPG
jgi:hypothetical protein